MYDRFSGLKFWSRERNTEKTMSHLYFNEKSHYSEENTWEKEVFCSTIERNKHIHVLAADLLHAGLE